MYEAISSLIRVLPKPRQVPAMSKSLFLIAIALHLTACQGFAVQPRIIDGFLSNPEEFPFFVNVVPVSAEGKPLTRCGGVILNERYKGRNL